VFHLLLPPSFSPVSPEETLVFSSPHRLHNWQSSINNDIPSQGSQKGMLPYNAQLIKPSALPHVNNIISSSLRTASSSGWQFCQQSTSAASFVSFVLHSIVTLANWWSSFSNANKQLHVHLLCVSRYFQQPRTTATAASFLPSVQHSEHARSPSSATAAPEPELSRGEPQ